MGIWVWINFAVRGLVWGVLIVTYWFVVWRRMRIDYPEEKIFSFLLWLSLAGLAGGVAGWKILDSPGLIGLWAMILITGLWCKKHAWDVWEWGDVLGTMWLVWGAIGYVFFGNWWTAVGLGVGVLTSWWIAKSYRKFRWYKSGKIGILGAFCVGWWGMTEIVVANIGNSGIYWVGFQPTWIPAVGLGGVALLAIYRRSELKLEEKLWRKVKAKK